MSDLSNYQEKVENSVIAEDLHRTRNHRQVFSKGFLVGGALANMLEVSGGRFPPGAHFHTHDDASVEVFVGNRDRSYPKPDGKYTFDKLSSVFATGNATRDDAPNHIRIQREVPFELALMWRNMCPAQVYELPDEVLEKLNNGRDELEGTTVDLQITPSNCVQCGAITAKGVTPSAGVVSLTKGLVPPDGTPPTIALQPAFGPERVACLGGPAHAREMVEGGAGLICASHSPRLAETVAEVFRAGRVVCEASNDPVGVELAGCAKNAAALAAGATESQGLNAAGMAAADIFGEVLALAEQNGGSPRTFLGRAGTGDPVATALAPASRNRSAGELLATGGPAPAL